MPISKHLQSLLDGLDAAHLDLRDAVLARSASQVRLRVKVVLFWLATTLQQSGLSDEARQLRDTERRL